MSDLAAASGSDALATSLAALGIDFPPHGHRRTQDEALRRALHEAFDGMCFYTGRAVSLEAMHVDHVVPRSAGGPDNVFNYVLACPEANVRKGAGFDPSAVVGPLYLVRTRYAPRVLGILELLDRRARRAAARQAAERKAVAERAAAERAAAARAVLHAHPVPKPKTARRLSAWDREIARARTEALHRAHRLLPVFTALQERLRDTTLWFGAEPGVPGGAVWYVHTGPDPDDLVVEAIMGIGRELFRLGELGPRQDTPQQYLGLSGVQVRAEADPSLFASVIELRGGYWDFSWMRGVPEVEALGQVIPPFFDSLRESCAVFPDDTPDRFHLSDGSSFVVERPDLPPPDEQLWEIAYAVSMFGPAGAELVSAT